MNILLADDDMDDRVFFRNALKEVPIVTTLSTVNDGIELMAYLADNLNQLPDVIFLDLSMPLKTGYECLNDIKEDEKLKHLPVIVFSTSFTRGVAFERQLSDQLCTMGAHHYIRKPPSFEQLIQVINQALIKGTETKLPNRQ
ncbi:MAG TPA: response regulator [Bacteroidia bacterium]